LNRSKLTIYADGSCKGNPGIMGIGILIKSGNEVLKEISKEIGWGTNNVAELEAIKIALEEAKLLEALEIELFSDSQWAIRVLKGE